MKKIPTIFVSYNSNVESEQTLAVRLHSIGAVNGFRMFLPDRYDSNFVLGNDTKNRIDESDYFVVFSHTGKLTSIVEQEIQYAFEKFKKKSRILIIHDITKPSQLEVQSNSYTEIGLNPVKDTIESSIHKIIEQIKSTENQNNTENGLLALLGIGLGLWILSAIISED